MFRDKILYSQPFGLQDAFIHSNICGSQTFTPGFCFCAVFRALRQPAQVAGCRRAFFYHLKGVEKYESEIYLPQLWNPFGL